VVSGGPDGAVHPDAMTLRAATTGDDDIIFENGEFVAGDRDP
jgi:hypothetical protein